MISAKNLLLLVLFISITAGCFLNKSKKENEYRKKIRGTWGAPGVSGSCFRFGHFKMKNLDSTLDNFLPYGAKFKYGIAGDTLVICFPPGSTSKSKIISISKDTLVLSSVPGLNDIYLRKK